MTAAPTWADDDRAARALAASALPPRIAFVGFGLIAGSVARAIRAAGASSELAAWSPDGRGPAEGRRLGILDRAAGSLAEVLDGAGLVVMAGPPLAVVAGLDEIAGARGGPLADGATITDVASTKGDIVRRADELQLASFVGGHPMAGRESSGVAASDADLFIGRPWVIVLGQRSDVGRLADVRRLALATGARVVEMSAEDHDRAVAAISHLPLVVSAALVEAVAGGGRDWSAAHDLAASGWRDTTRLALGDPEMGAGILATNATAVAGRLRDVRAAIEAWIEALEVESPDAAALRARLAAAKAALEE